MDEGNAGRDDDEGREKSVRLFKALLEVGAQGWSFDEGRAVHVGQCIGGHIDGRAIAQEWAGGLFPHRHPGGKNLLVDAQSGSEGQRLGWVEAMLGEHPACVGFEEWDTRGIRKRVSQSGFANPMCAAKSDS